MLTLLLACAVTMALWAEPTMRAPVGDATSTRVNAPNAGSTPRDVSAFAVTP